MMNDVVNFWAVDNLRFSNAIIHHKWNKEEKALNIFVSRCDECSHCCFFILVTYISAKDWLKDTFTAHHSASSPWLVSLQNKHYTGSKSMGCQHNLNSSKPLFHFFQLFLLFSVMMNKDVKMPKKTVLTSKQHVEHQFTGRNTQ